MNTPLELYALQRLAPLQAAQVLAGLSLAELHAVVNRLDLKVRRNADREELKAAILAHSHPAPAPASAEELYTQERFV